MRNMGNLSVDLQQRKTGSRYNDAAMQLLLKPKLFSDNVTKKQLKGEFNFEDIMA